MSAKLWTTVRAEKRPIRSASENQFAFRSSRDSSFVITIGSGDTILRRRRTEYDPRSSKDTGEAQEFR
jgi:hypothetical protein